MVPVPTGKRHLNSESKKLKSILRNANNQFIIHFTMKSTGYTNSITTKIKAGSCGLNHPTKINLL
jgi:hypothetical protein